MPSYLPSLRDINGDKSVCDFSETHIKEEHKAVGDILERTTDKFNCGSHANEALVQSL